MCGALGGNAGVDEPPFVTPCAPDNHGVVSSLTGPVAAEQSGDVPDPLLSELTEWVTAGDVVVLSGAGISTESGIPDYRGPSGASLRKHAPMTYQAFTREPQARHRYWARSFIGWPRMRVAQPNSGHYAVAALERHGLVRGVITQNVDGLHSAAGSKNVIDLHGRLSRVVCLACDTRFARDEIHAALEARNGDWEPRVLHINPDGDVDVQPSDLDSFTMIDCMECDGPLKPDVVYFGESVPPQRVGDAMAMLESARSLLVLGSSLTVYSGRRFVMRAAAHGIPVAIINQGPTRGDEHAEIKVEAPLGATLGALLRHVGVS